MFNGHRRVLVAVVDALGYLQAELFEGAPRPPPRQLDLYEDNDEIRLVRKPWAWLIRHVFLEDVSVCPKCDGPMRWLQVATKLGDIARLMSSHGLADPPSPRPRAPPPGQLRLPFSVR